MECFSRLLSFCTLLGGLLAAPVGAVSSSGCDFKIYYNRWVTTFEPHEYKAHGRAVNGQHCLEACCRDPSCKGLALESALNSQCYKYARSPEPLDEDSQALSSFLAGDRVSQWSIFIKNEHGSQLHRLQGGPVLNSFEFTDALSAALTSRPIASPVMASEEVSLDRKLRGVDKSLGMFQSKCQWTVHYDTWIPTFDKGEYSHDDFNGENAHCLEKCCHDPTCVGLTLESTELYQCYKYSHLPRLDVRMGLRLGDGHWLQQKRAAWSVFVKATVPASTNGQDVSQMASTNGILATRLVPRVPKVSLQMSSSAVQAFLETLLASSAWTQMRWCALGVVLLSVVALVSDKIIGSVTRRSQTMLELKVRHFDNERAPLRSVPKGTQSTYFAA